MADKIALMLGLVATVLWAFVAIVDRGALQIVAAILCACALGLKVGQRCNG